MGITYTGAEFRDYCELLSSLATVYWSTGQLEKPDDFDGVRGVVLSWMDSDEKMRACKQELEYAIVAAWKTKT